MKKSIICIGIIYIIIMTSCSNNIDSKTEISEIIENDNTETFIGDEKNTKLSPGLPTDKNYDNYEFIFFARGSASGKWECKDIASEGENGETMNDAVFRRNTFVEDTYGVKISQISGSDSELYSKTKANIMAGDTIYDCVLVPAKQAAMLAMEGYLYDLSEVPYMNLSQPWWDQRSIADLSINDHIYFVAGDMTTLDKIATYVLSFNKTLIGEYDLTNPYDLVDQGLWTVDRFSELAKSVTRDLDGDGVMNLDDQYGFLTYSSSAEGFIYAAGGKMCNFESDGRITLNFYNDAIITMLEKLFDIAYSEHAFNFNLAADGENVATAMFTEGRALFCYRALVNLMFFRDMETDYGILPLPKLDDNQDNYYNGVRYNASFVTVPLISNDIECTGIILEAMAAESLYTVKPSYYETQLNGKYFRDDESGRMLDIIFSTRIFDLGYYCQWGGFPAALESMVNKYNSDYTSFYASYEPKLIADLENTIDAFNNIIK